MKDQPLQSLPGNWCAFNGMFLEPFPITRTEAANCLVLARRRARVGNGRIEVVRRGQYVVSTFNSVVITTR
jgi:hypothetical protein